jgi:hypothetical protein
MSPPESTPTHLPWAWQPYARVGLNPMPESTLPLSKHLIDTEIRAQIRPIC